MTAIAAEEIANDQIARFGFVGKHIAIVPHKTFGIVLVHGRIDDLLGIGRLGEDFDLEERIHGYRLVRGELGQDFSVIVIRIVEFKKS